VSFFEQKVAFCLCLDLWNQKKNTISKIYSRYFKLNLWLFIESPEPTWGNLVGSFVFGWN
jgi:hypothetical protein